MLLMYVFTVYTANTKYTIELCCWTKVPSGQTIELIKWLCYLLDMFDICSWDFFFFFCFLFSFVLSSALIMASVLVLLRWQFDRNRCARSNWSWFHPYISFYLCSIVQKPVKFYVVCYNQHIEGIGYFVRCS